VFLHDWVKVVGDVLFLIRDVVQVSRMEMYLTTTDHVVRSRGFLLYLCFIFFVMLELYYVSII
jgi:hypothetical protein